MVEKWHWNLRHTLDSKQYSPYENGQVTSATLKNTGKIPLHIYGFGIKFEWQRETKSWWSGKCDIFLDPGEETKLPVVKFRIPIDIEPRIYKRTTGVQTESEPEDEISLEEWEDHGIVWGNKEHEVEITRHPDRGFQVFISHSNHKEDKQLMKTLSDLLSNNGIGYFIAEEIPKYGEILWKKVKSGIISADRVLILWTKHAARSGDVREELGIIVGARKRFIPIIEKDVEQKGSLTGTESIRFDRDTYKEIFITLTEELIKFSVEKAKRAKKIKPEEELPS